LEKSIDSSGGLIILDSFDGGGRISPDKTLVDGVEGEDERSFLLRSDSLGVVGLSFEEEGVGSFRRYSLARSSSEKSPSTSLFNVSDGRTVDVVFLFSLVGESK
jgi:hypothetical protein